MGLIIRIDVDRPYGRHPTIRHFLSRVSSDFYFPRVAALGFLSELKLMLRWLNEKGSRAYVFFRRCTLPSSSVLDLVNEGQHEIGLHLENSRSLNAFLREKRILEKFVGRKILAISKHGSGTERFGLRHYAPYEPEKYVRWAQMSSMRLFLGNLQDPSIPGMQREGQLYIFHSAFWLELPWRDIKHFTIDWLLEHAMYQDIVLLVHPENVLADSKLTSDFKMIVNRLESRII